jgi:hypothetical protein
MQNIRVMAKYYTRVRISRMSELLDLSDAVSGTFVSLIYVTIVTDCSRIILLWRVCTGDGRVPLGHGRQ